MYDTLGVKNGHEYVDLGLSVKWATCNVGASSPDGYGNYFAWGDATRKVSFSWETYLWMEEGYSSWSHVSKYTINDYQYSGIWYDSNENFIGDGKRVVESDDDAANVSWGEDWGTPTFGEWADLKNKCSWQWTSSYNGTGVTGYIVTSKVAGYTDRSIFLPAGGMVSGSKTDNATKNGCYWSSTVSDNASDNAYGFGFYSTSRYFFDLDRFYGLTIRPVRH